MRAHRRGGPGAAARQAGMTLLEIMIVLAILGSLMAFLIGPALWKQFREAQIKETRILINQYETALIFWRTNQTDADCPATLEELHAGSLANAPPVDLWGQPLVYHCPGRDGSPWEVYSKGPDRVDATEDDVRRSPPERPR
jgi:general secretion pathway protein G